MAQLMRRCYGAGLVLCADLFLLLPASASFPGEADVVVVAVRARDSVHGYGGAVSVVELRAPRRRSG